MVDLADEKSLIQQEETRFQFAISESLMQKVGKVTNFIVNRNHQEKQWFVNGSYDLISVPLNGIDGFTFFKFDAEIVDVWLYVQSQTGASSGYTEVDVQYASTPGGSWTTIFSTKPRINYNAGNDIWIHVGSAVSNTTAPVVSVTNMDENYALRVCLTGVPVGLPVSGCGFGVIVAYRPR
jgi:hypothetical protein